MTEPMRITRVQALHCDAGRQQAAGPIGRCLRQVEGGSQVLDASEILRIHLAECYGIGISPRTECTCRARTFRSGCDGEITEGGEHPDHEQSGQKCAGVDVAGFAEIIGVQAGDERPDHQ